MAATKSDAVALATAEESPASEPTPLQEAIAHGRAPGDSNTPMPTPPALTGGSTAQAALTK